MVRKVKHAHFSHCFIFMYTYPHHQRDLSNRSPSERTTVHTLYYISYTLDDAAGFIRVMYMRYDDKKNEDIPWWRLQFFFSWMVWPLCVLFGWFFISSFPRFHMLLFFEFFFSHFWLLRYFRSYIRNKMMENCFGGCIETKIIKTKEKKVFFLFTHNYYLPCIQSNHSKHELKQFHFNRSFINSSQSNNVIFWVSYRWWWCLSHCFSTHFECVGFHFRKSVLMSYGSGKTANTLESSWKQNSNSKTSITSSNPTLFMTVTCLNK